MKRILFIILTAMAVVGCESDEICDRNVNTPRLLVRFYDPNQLRSPFSVTNLTVYAEGSSKALVTNAATDSLALPLRLTNPTVYVLQKIETGNVTRTATLTLSYQTHETFVSKACGIKTTYSTLTATISPTTSWLKGIRIQNSTVDNEKRAHIHLYH